MITSLERLKEILQEAQQLVDKLDEHDPPPQVTEVVIQPAPNRAAKPDKVLRRGEATYTGKIGRPDFRLTRNGTPLWTAGLGIDQGDGTLQWLKLQAWKQVADTANTNFDSGDVVTIIGKSGVSRFTDQSGVIVKTEVIIVTSIDWAD